MIKLQIQSDKEDSVIDIIRAANSAEIKRLEIGLDKTIKRIEKFETEQRCPVRKLRKTGIRKR